MPDLRAETIPAYEAEILEYLADPVGTFDSHEAAPHAAAAVAEGTLLVLGVDLNAPRDVILALVDEEVRSAQAKRHTQANKRKTRIRADKDDQYLAIYDRAFAGEPFSVIASQMNKPVSTIKSGYLIAYGRVFGAGQQKPTKRALPMAGLDIGNHIKTCRTCAAADRFEAMCQAAKTYADQDSTGRRDLSVAEPERLVSRARRKHSLR